MKSKYAKFLTCGLCAGLITLAWAQAHESLTISGHLVSTNVIEVNGHAYVPIADIAKAQNLAVVAVAGGYEIRAAGGAHQVNGNLRGNIGDPLFNGKWQLIVKNVSVVNGTYTAKFSPDGEGYNPNGANDELVVVTCSLKNTRQDTEAAMLSYHHPYNTALTDDQGQSYPPMGYDRRGGTDWTPDMLPGSQLNFAIIFSVPKGTVLKDLVFSLLSFPPETNGGTDVRVSLAQ